MHAAAEPMEKQGAALKQYAIVFFASLAILGAGIAANPSFTFDEFSYIGAARNFIAGTPSMNPEHPPLAKYLMALSITLLGDRALGWRLPSAIAGAMVAVSAFGLTLRLSRSLHTAYIAWFMIVANGFWYVMSRMAMLSIFELAFEVAAVWVFVLAAERSSARWFVCSGALFGLSIASRWCGVVGLAVCAAYALVYYRPAVKNLALMTGSAIAVYVGSWIPLLLREHRSAQYLIAANIYILQFHRHATTDPRPGEPWWTWIVTLDLQQAPMELIANPVIEILGLAAIIVLLWRRKPLLPALYIAHEMQWAVVPHWSHYYYYLEAFTFLTVALAVAMQDVVVRRVRLDVVVTACAVGAVVWPFWMAMMKHLHAAAPSRNLLGNLLINNKLSTPCPSRPLSGTIDRDRGKDKDGRPCL